MPPLMNELLSSVKTLLQEALATSFTLFKITIPLSLISKMLDAAGVTEYIGIALSPVMNLVGLPGEMGVVWATAMLTNLYGAMVVFAALAPSLPLTVAQVTVLTTMMLVAHGLPVELRIAQKAGPRLRVMLVLRVVGAFFLGWLLYRIYHAAGYLDTPFTMRWHPPDRDVTWLNWVAGEFQNMIAIFIIIVLLLFTMRVLRRVGLLRMLKRMLEPLLSLLGMSRHAAPVTIIGMTMGIAYGGGLIIQEARSGRIGKYDIFFSLSLMGLSHSLVEDTLLMVILGGHVSGLLFGRIAFSLLVIFLFVKWVRRLPEHFFDRHFFRTVQSSRTLDSNPD